MNNLTRPSHDLVLTFAAIESLIHNQQLQEALPFVRYAFRRWNTQQHSGCSKCGKNRAEQDQRRYLANTVRDGLVTLDKSRLDRVKQILHVDKLIGLFDQQDGGKIRKEV